MVRRDKAPDRYPRNTETLLELAQGITAQRSPNVVQRRAVSRTPKGLGAWRTSRSYRLVSLHHPSTTDTTLGR